MAAKDSWFTEIEDSVYSYLVYCLKSKNDAPYPSMFITNTNENLMPTDFPTLCVREIAAIERGQTFDKVVGAVLSTVQLDMYSKNRDSCIERLSSAVMCLKNLGFEMVAMPLYQKQGQVYIGTARCRRIVGSGDSDLISQDN